MEKIDKSFYVRTFLLLLLGLGYSGGAMAQVQQGYSATVSQSDGWSPQFYNDGTTTGNYGYLITYTTPAWIEFSWPSPVAFNELAVYHNFTFGQMTGADIEVYRNGTWENVTSFSGMNSQTFSLDFPTVVTNRLRINNVSPINSYLYINEIEVLLNAGDSTNDVGVAAVDSPVAFCQGTHPVVVSLLNFGNNPITSATVNWEVDGVPQTSYSFSGSIDTIGGTGSHLASMNLGTVSWSNNNPKTITVWTTSPNGQSDPVTANDTLEVTVQPALNGTFTVGGSSADFPTLYDAANALSTRGVCGPTTFLLPADTFNEKLVLNEIVGASATNPITFLGAGVDSTHILFDGVSGDMATLTLNGADYVTFEDMTLENIDTYYGTVIQLTNRADHNTFRNINALMPATSTGYYSTGILGTGSANSYGAGDAGRYNLFEDIYVRGGYYGVYFYGTASTTPTSDDNTFQNVEVDAPYYYGFYFNSMDSVQLFDSEVTGIRASGYGLYVYGCMNYNIQRNFLEGITYGAYFGNSNYYQTPTGRSTFASNMVYASNSYALRYYYSGDVDMQHNTIVSDASYATYFYYSNGIDFRNNIVVQNSTGDYIFYSYNTTFDMLDYNLYWSASPLYYEGTTYTSLQAWQSASPYNQNSWQDAPGFISASNWHLSPISPPKRGPYVGVTHDVDGNPYCVYAPTVGADESVYPVPSPVAAFAGPDTIWVNSPTTFYNAAAADAASVHQWSIDGVPETDALHLSKTFTSTGTVDIKLVTQNCGGIDSVMQTVVVATPTQTPEVSFVADKNIVEVYESVQFTDLTTNGPTAWTWRISPDSIQTSISGITFTTPTYTVLNGSVNTQHPEISFDYPGSYSVKLVATNAAGSDSVVYQDYVLVKATANLCIFPFDTDVPSGVLYDDGGPTGSYGNGHSGINVCYYHIHPCADSIELDFSEFELAAGDYLRIYDGSDNSATPLWDVMEYPMGMTGFINDPSVMTHLVAHSGEVYIEFETSASGTAPGFTMEWTSTPGTFAPPVAGFAVADTVCLNVPTALENLSTGANNSYAWDIGADGFVDGTGENLSYVFTQTGPNPVQLVVENCGGTDTFQMMVNVVSPNHAPNPGFTTSITRPTLTDVVTFMDTSTYCVDQWEWEITPNTYQEVNGTTPNGPVYQVMFEQPGVYDVKLKSGNAFGWDSVMKQNHIEVIQYCTPSVVNENADIGISLVSLNTLYSTSSIGAEGYNDYTNSRSTTLEKGVSYPFHLERLSNNNAMSRKAWIDYNQDGDFTDPGELIASQASTYALAYDTTVVVPATALDGATRMRVATNFASFPNTPCGPHQFGEFEDYRINISADLTAPEISLLGSDTMYLSQCDPFVDPGYEAEDNVDGIITQQVMVDSGALAVCVVDTYYVTYNVIDAAANEAQEVTRVVIVLPDVEPPTVTLLGSHPDTVEVFNPYVDPGATAFDSIDGNLSVTVVGTVDTSTVGMYTLTYVATDQNNNTGSAVRNVYVVDLTAPTIALNGDDSVYVAVDSPWTDPMATGTDTYDGNVTVTATGLVDLTTVGEYKVTYCVTDQSGNGPICTERYVFVEDHIAPTATLIGADTVNLEVGENWIDLGLNIRDNYYGKDDLVTSVGGTWPGHTDTLGTFTIVYTVTDPSGNVDTVVRVLNIMDTQAPSIALLGAHVMEVKRWRTFNDPGVFVDDNFDDDPTIMTEGTFDVSGTDLEGTYYRTYWAVDQSGNESERVTRWIHVVPNVGIGETPLDEAVSLFPNPNRGQFTLSLELPSMEQVTIEVLDMMGKELLLVESGVTRGGDYAVDLSEAGSGIYFVRIVTTEHTLTRKVTVTR